MEEFEKNIINIVNKKISTPPEYRETIKKTLDLEPNKFKYSFLKTATTIGLSIIMTTGIVIAGYNAYEKIWKEPRQYDELKEKPSIISQEEKQNAVSEKSIRKDAQMILEKLGYPDKEIRKVELFRSYDDNTNIYYCASTENKYGSSELKRNIGIYIDFNGDTGEFQYFINNDFSEIKNKLESLGKDDAIKLAKETLNSIGYTPEQYEIKTCTNIEGNEWQIVFSRIYNGIYNRFDEFQISFGIIEDKVVVESVYGLQDNNFDNNEFVLTEQEAIEIAKKKELEFSNEEIIEITANKSIEKMNSYIYCIENNIENQFSVKTENKIRNVWVVKIKHNDDNADYTLPELERQKRYMSKKYYIDATTGEIIGGEQAQFSLGIE